MSCFASGAVSLEEQMRKRERKIEQLKRRRQLDQTLSELTLYVKQEHADDEHVVMCINILDVCGSTFFC